jgi:sulfoxide reductase heme-binding subunit YedZ
MKIEQRYRFIYKPLVFAACAIPFVLMVLGAFEWLGQDLGPDPIAELIHRCGKTSLNLLLITLLVTPVRNLLGLPHLLRLRRMLGLFAFFYAVLHFTVYIVLEQELDLASLPADIVKRPYITVGFLALVLLIPLAVTSTNKMMRRLGRRWQKLHRLIYPIAALGVLHFLWQVKQDIREPLLYAGMLAVLLGYRAVVAYRKRAVVRERATSKSVSATTPERT